MMNPNTITAVQVSWRSISVDPVVIARSIYGRLFANDPTLAALFDETDLPRHRATLVTSLTAMVDALDEPERLVAIAGSLGRTHLAHRVEKQHLDVFGEALLETLSGMLDARLTPELHDAWVEAYALIASLMMRAIEHAELKPAVPAPS
jgi:hemoglobin-like flavoprotein